MSIMKKSCLINWGITMKKKKLEKVKHKKGNRKHPKLLFLKWRNLKLSKKYMIVFFLTIALFVTSAIIVYLQLNHGQKDIQAVDDYSNQLNDVSQLAILIQAKDVQSADYLLTQNAQYIDSFKEYQNDFNELASKLESTLVTKEQRSLFQEIKEKNESIDTAFLDRMVSSLEGDNDIMANTLRDYSSRMRNDTILLVNELMELMKEDQSNALTQAKNSSNTSIYVLVSANLLVLIIGIPLMIIVSRGITSRLKQVVHLTSRVANGDLQSDSIKDHGKDEIGQLATSVNLMKENIKAILMKVQNASSSVSSRSKELTQSATEVKEGSNQIATTMEELSTGSESQANSASNLSETMLSFVDKVRSSEEKGKDILTSSEGVQQLTNQGKKLMQQSVTQMKQIDTIVAEAVNKVQGLEHQSTEISKLVLVIKDIADQTNLLSLNAAIEAARAGEHGKGFAVVADEVRRLSEQVASSVGEITSIVTTIQDETNQVVQSLNNGYHEVKEGTNQIEATGDNFNSINTAVLEMTSRINDISQNLNDIAASSMDMNNLIEEIASVSEESAAAVEQAAASAQQSSSSMEEVSGNANELSVLAEQLNKEVNVFKL